MPFQPTVDPLGSLWLSAVVALLPLIVMFFTLGGLRWKAHWAGIASLVTALVVAIAAFKMPFGFAFLAATQGAVFGIFPITFIVFAAIWLYQLTVVSGRFEDLRSTFSLVSDDPRVLAILIAFCFGGLLEALAGFGAPVAITGVMLMAVGFSALRAAIVVLVANTAPVAFGAIAIPIITAGNLTGIDYHQIGAYVGHQTPFLAAFVPLLLVYLVDGKHGVKDTYPVAIVMGVAFGVAQWISATWLSVELTDVVASLVGMVAGVAMLKVWQPKGRDAALARLQMEREKEIASGAEATPQTHEPKAADLTNGRIAMALFPYLLVVVIFVAAKLVPPLTAALAKTDIKFGWPGLHGNILSTAGKVSSATMFNFNWLSNPGTLLIITGIIVMAVYRIPVKDAWGEFTNMLFKMRWSALTISSVLSLAYVMNMSGQTIAIGTWIAGTGAAFAFLSPILGWLGTAVTGSDTSANALFSTLQQAAGQAAGIDPTLLVSANTTGGVVGKMVSTQNLAIAATAVGLSGQESVIFRKVVGLSLGMLVLLCLLIGLQSTPVLSWMLP